MKLITIFINHVIIATTSKAHLSTGAMFPAPSSGWVVVVSPSPPCGVVGLWYLPPLPPCGVVGVWIFIYI